MKYETFIAKRYLVSKHKINFITIISLLSVAGITIGVAALIVVLSVFNGFGSLVKSFLISLDPDVRIEIISPEGYNKISYVENLLKENKDVIDYAPFVSGKVLAFRQGETQVVTLKGITEDAGKNLYQLKSSVIFGKYDLTGQNQIPGVLIGLPMADHLESITGDTLTLVSPAGIERAIAQYSLPNSRKFVIEGIFNSKNNDYDDNYMFTSLQAAQSLLGYGKNFQGFELKLKNRDESEQVKAELLKHLDQNLFSVNTWYDFHRELYTVMQIERWTAYIILSLIIAVATFNILGSLSMSVVEKQRDIGILRTMGVNEKSILKIFMYEGLLIGIIGTILGSLLGYFICFLQIQYKIYPLNPLQYKIDALPLQIQVGDFFFIAGISLLLSFLASLYPAKKATKVNPLEAIKWE